MSGDLLLTRDEVLGGLPARRAAALLFLIESRTAHLVDRARHAMERFRNEEVDRERELEYVEAFALGRQPPLRPTIQDLERFAPQWADLVPENPRLRAAVAHLVGGKYQFTAADIPQLRLALGLDDPAVRQAHERLYRESLDAVYSERPSPTARARWAMRSATGRLESLPPFWTAFALTLTETVGAGVLALPIALAGVGPMPGIIMLIIFGLVNMVTVAWLAETAARTANIRYGGAYFGRMVTQYLGNVGAFLLTLALVIIAVVVLVAYAIGFSTTLASTTGVAAAFWVVVLFAGVTFMVSRNSISSTVASALAIGALNMFLVTLLAVLGLVHVSTANLTHGEVPGFGGTPFELGFLGLIFGVILSSYFGHTSVGNCAAVVLQRDPSARSLFWGVVAAQLTAIVLYSIWILGVNGAIASDVLASQAGTALEPLADVAGPAVRIFGTVFVVLAMGMGSIHMATGLVNSVRERLPRRVQPVVLLPRGGGRLVFEPRGEAEGRVTRLILTYQGQDGGRPVLRVQAQAAGRAQRVEVAPTGPWNVLSSLDRIPAGALEKHELAVEIISADTDQARLQLTSTLDMAYEGDWTSPGFDLASLLDSASDASDPDGDLLRWMLRRGRVTEAEAAAWAGEEEARMGERLRTLVERGAVRAESTNGTMVYRASVARRRARQVSTLLDRATAADTRPSRRTSIGTAVRDGLHRSVGLLLSDNGRRVIEYSPLLLVVLLTEWLVVTDRASFAQTLSFSGVIAVPIFAGIFPCLLIVSSRRKGDIVPGIVSRFLGQPWLVVTVYLLFLLGILVHGLFIWDQPMERAAALITCITMVLVTALAIRRGAFGRRTVVMLREDQRPGGEAALEIVSGGRLAESDVRLEYPEGAREMRTAAVVPLDIATLREVWAGIPVGETRDIKVWTKRVTPEGNVESMPARLHVIGGSDDKEIDLRLAGGMVVFSAGDAPGSITIALEPPVLPPQEPPGKPRRRGSTLVDLQSLSDPVPDSGPLPAKGDSP